MNVVAYCARSYEGATLGAVGEQANLLVCPPIGGNFIIQHPESLEGFDVVVFNLHGWQHHPMWTGDMGMVALASSALEQMNLSGSGVFAINCWLGDEHMPMFKALKKSGVDWIIAGAGVNYAGVDSPVGADVVLKWFLRYYSKGMEVEKAFRKAKIAAALLAPKANRSQVIALSDALKFKLWRF